jgi:uncharacterized protein YdaU (DUF1376 family)
MSQNREPPAYQEYASSMLAKFEFRRISIAQRGLLYTMRLECWVNGFLPSDEQQLAQVLGVAHQEVSSALPALKPFFTCNGESITCPELDNYKQHLAERREKQSAGGKKGSRTTNKRNKKPSVEDDHPTLATTSPSRSSGDSKVPRQGTAESLVQQNPSQPNKNKLTGGGGSTEEWLAEYDSATFTAQQYRNRRG